ncbi:MAG: hypothetical protein IJY61_00880 [Candidatus Gastranaerophilales bacterium]|nr:hypothetical protein [Candidatus Gastranaerophilales bacterium]
MLEPQRLSEKILKSCLDDKDIKKTKLTDKLKAKEYVKNVIPDLKYAKVYQIADSFNELDFSFAPNSFVIKTNHAWKTHILVQDKRLLKSTDYNEFKQYYKSVLSINYAYWGSYELQYKNITPKIFLEEYLCFENEGFIKEYEVYCFKGKPMFINYLISPNYTPDLFNCQSDIVKSQIFDTNWEQANFKIRFSSGLSTPDTKNKELILTYAEKLSYGFDFVRIDIFEIGDELYFGEFTFSPYSGFITFIPEKFDLIYGQKY